MLPEYLFQQSDFLPVSGICGIDHRKIISFTAAFNPVKQSFRLTWSRLFSNSAADTIRSIRWETIFIYGGTVSLSTAMNNSGLNKIIANGMSSMLGGVTNVYIVAGAFFLASFALTQFTSNRTVGAVFRPISIAAAVGLGIDPRFTLLAIHYGSSLSTLTPMATSCQLLAYNEGGFNMKEFAIGSIGPALVYFITFMVWFPVCFNVL